MTKASIGIFKKSIEHDQTVVQPHTPDEVFLATKRVSETKVPEVLRLTDGLYVIQYSDNGPFCEAISEEWLPVHIMKLHQWSSGGIKISEMKDFDEEIKANEHGSSDR